MTNNVAMRKDKPIFKFALRADLEGKTEFLPSRSHTNDTGFDVLCAERSGIKIKPFEYAKIKLGFRSIPPEGYWYKLVPRSSSFAKKSLHCLYGTIDEGYENELVFACQYIPARYVSFSAFTPEVVDYYNQAALSIDFGEKIAQIIPVKRQEIIVREISNDEFTKLISERNGLRGTGGFGSTG